MADTTQTLYFNDVKRLTSSIILKHKATADAQNEFYAQWKGVDFSPELETEWPYYKHLAGEYVDGIDEVMKVTSLDTLEEIEFTYDNLLIHRATAKAYTVDSTYYNALLAQYPDYENLIRGIINPVPVEVAVAAPDFTLLAWDRTLVESNESNLMPKLQTWVNNFVHRYYQPRWAITQKFYEAAFIYQLSNKIPDRIALIRLQNCGTQYVHSYHLWAKLGSHGRLNRFRDYLTLKQALTLYRNIDYYENNAGQNNTYQELISVILTERGIPLTAYQIWHDVSEIETDLVPKAEIAKVPQNDPAVLSTGIAKATIPDLLDREIPMARDNVYYYDSQVSRVPLKARQSYTSTLATKALESEMIDRTDATPVKLIDTIYNEWVYLACDNRYTANVVIENPKTQDVITLSAREALTLWIYATLRSYEVEPSTIPQVWAQGVMRPKAPGFLELKRNTNAEYISDTMLLLALTEHTPVGKIVAVETFYKTCVAIQGNRLAHRILYSTQENLYTRGYLEGVTLRFYLNQLCTLVDDATQTYPQWLAMKELNFDDFSATEMGTLSENLFTAATGISLKNTVSLGEIQSAMIGIMSQLSPYSVQFLKKINEGPFTVPDNLGIRFTRTAEAGESSLKIDVGIRFDEHVDERGRSRHVLDMIRAVDLTNVGFMSQVRIGLHPGVNFRSDGINHTHVPVNFPGVRFSLKLDPGIGDVMEESRLNGLKLVHVSPNPITQFLGVSQLRGLDVVKMSPPVTANVTSETLNGLDLFYVGTDAVTLSDAFKSLTLGGFQLPANT